MTALYRPFLLAFWLCFSLLVQGTEAHTGALSIPEMHEIAEALINTKPDSSIKLLNLATNSIQQLPPSDLKAQYTAENQVRLSDYWAGRKPAIAKPLLAEALAYYRQHPNNEKLASIFYTKARIAREENIKNYCTVSDAFLLYDTALTYALQQEDDFITSAVYFELGSALQHAQRWHESLDKGLMALEYAIKDGDSAVLCAANLLLGRTYEHFNLLNKSERHMQQALQYATKKMTGFHMMDVYGSALIKNNKLDQGLEIYRRALKIAVSGKATRRETFTFYGKMGNTLLDAKRWDEALEHYKACKEYNKIQPRALNDHLVFYARVNVILGNTKQALKEINIYAEQTDFSQYRAENLDIFRHIATVYRDLGEHEKSAFYFERWGKLKDSLYQDLGKVQLNEMERLFLSERTKNKQITEVNQHLQASKTQQATFGIAALLLLLGAGISIYLIRTRSLKEKQELLFRLKSTQLEKMMEAQEAERKRLARELHDGVGQSLAALKMQMEMSGEGLASHRTIRRLDALCKEVRTLSHQMLPKTLEEHGLKNAIAMLIAQSLKRKGIKTEFVVDGFEQRLDGIVEIHIYRIAQELITNVLRHSEAQEVGIQLLEMDTKIILIVEDNGKGFSKKHHSEGIGLTNIQSRLDAISGYMEMNTAPDEGTYIRIAVPIAKEKRITA